MKAGVNPEAQNSQRRKIKTKCEEEEDCGRGEESRVEAQEVRLPAQLHWNTDSTRSNGRQRGPKTYAINRVHMPLDGHSHPKHLTARHECIQF